MEYFQLLISCMCKQKEEDAEDPDAESRMNAVRALAACAKELYSQQQASPAVFAAAAQRKPSTGPSDGSLQLPIGSQAEADAALDIQRSLCSAVDAAITALDDYSIDNRYAERNSGLFPMGSVQKTRSMEAKHVYEACPGQLHWAQHSGNRPSRRSAGHCC